MRSGVITQDDYLKLLATSAVVDYDADNVTAYAADPASVAAGDVEEAVRSEGEMPAVVVAGRLRDAQ